MHDELRIGICSERDIVLLARQFSSGDRGVHAFRYTRQQDGRSTYLIAWLGEVPVGHLDLRWQGAEESLIAQQHLAEHAELNGIVVLSEYRSQGIGRRLIAAAEQMARERGFREACLGVNIENARARSLYERLGYRDWGHGVVEATWLLPDEHGTRHTEQVIYLRKELDNW
ncbi:MAG: GNAT family N-acetyltransferase [Armatimonadetes bacterium]|nr:GNAT family N-acetyltransferase [Armatimonadota bacterium]NIM23166.1 GNAT family N-acetyltransferase [Armatimonadota bacterium]NIM67034.1 GNAT family N-acetyltransferase [Armatimonadota bacterium]NIM75568.1 GNAT family N-acetyltransferase [Armatimonadota bacterium]NIN05223.1 GNAT family N-acetyltransferase [Armatimonadota bacterium]